MAFVGNETYDEGGGTTSKSRVLDTGIASLTEEQRKKVVANIEQLTYYHHRMHRTDVEAMCRADGDFLLRQGTRNDPDGYTISVRWNGKMAHFPIHWANGKAFFEGHAHALVQNLIAEYHTNHVPVTKRSGAYLMTGRTYQPWELLERQLQQHQKLGKGAFGTVYKGTWRRPDGVEVICAIKTLDIAASAGEEVLERNRVEMLREARVMREVRGHANVVRELGVTVDRDIPYAAMEFVSGGSLDKRLRASDKPVSVITKLKCCVDVARGLGWMARLGMIHRDVATRNILFEALPHDEIGICKVADFGLARNVGKCGVYKAGPDEQFPIVWTAIEGLLFSTWYLKSDVWSMGVIMWEIFSNGAKPYCDLLDLDKETISKHLKAGNRLQGPDDMPPEVGRIMAECMISDLEIRPPMSYIAMRMFDELVAVVEDLK